MQDLLFYNLKVAYTFTGFFLNENIFGILHEAHHIVGWVSEKHRMLAE